MMGIVDSVTGFNGDCKASVNQFQKQGQCRAALMSLFFYFFEDIDMYDLFASSHCTPLLLIAHA
jgi:hypothetical protein